MGYFYIKNNLGWGVQKGKIGALYYDEDTGKTVASAFRNIVINKGSPSFRDNYVGENVYLNIINQIII